MVATDGAAAALVRGAQLAAALINAQSGVEARRFLPLNALLTTALVLVLVAVVASLALSFRRDPQDIRTGTVGKPAPAFDLPQLGTDGRIALDSYRGRVVVLNFWASWCVPCKQENPALTRVWERYRMSEVVLLGIVYQDTTEAALDYTRRMGNTWPSVIDVEGRTAIAYGVFGIPETYFVGPDGVIAGRHIGPIDEETLIKGIEELRRRRG